MLFIAFNLGHTVRVYICRRTGVFHDAAIKFFALTLIANGLLRVPVEQVMESKKCYLSALDDDWFLKREKIKIVGKLVYTAFQELQTLACILFW